MTKWLIALFLALPMVTVSSHADLNSLEQGIKGTQGDVSGSVAQVKSRAQNAFKSLGVQQTGSSSQNGGTLQIIDGKKGGTQVQVKMNHSGPNRTHVAITAKQGKFGYQKQFAENILHKIIEHG